MKRLWIVLLVLSFAGLLGGEPLHAFIHDVTGTEHVDLAVDHAAGPALGAPDAACAFLGAWVSLLQLPTLSERAVPAPEFALEALTPERELVVRPFTRSVDLATRPRGPPARG